MEEYKFGALPPKTDLRDYKYEPVCASAAPYPTEFQLWIPPVKNLGQVCSCVAHVSAEIEEYFNNNECKEYLPLSPGYIYGCRYIHKSLGMYLRDALKTLKNRGICLHSEFPYNKEVPEIIDLFKKLDKEGFLTDEANTITSYFSINKNKIDDIKHNLMNNGPVMASIKWYNNFSLKDNVLSGNLTGDYSNHCVMVYGWNEKGWLILNSWGKNWGNKGTFIYPYDYGFNEAWGITDTENKEDIVIPQPKKNVIIDFLYKIVNFCINIFKR